MEIEQYITLTGYKTDQFPEKWYFTQQAAENQTGLTNPYKVMIEENLLPTATELLSIMYIAFLQDQIQWKDTIGLFKNMQQPTISSEWANLVKQHYLFARTSTGFFTLAQASSQFKKYFKLPDDYIKNQDIHTATSKLDYDSVYKILINCQFPKNYLFFKCSIHEATLGGRIVLF